MPPLAQILKKRTRKKLVDAGLIGSSRMKRLAGEYIAEANRRAVKRELEHMTPKDFDKLMREAPGSDIREERE